MFLGKRSSLFINSFIDNLHHVEYLLGSIYEKINHSSCPQNAYMLVRNTHKHTHAKTGYYCVKYVEEKTIYIMRKRRCMVQEDSGAAFIRKGYLKCILQNVQKLG